MTVEVWRPVCLTVALAALAAWLPACELPDTPPPDSSWRYGNAAGSGDAPRAAPRVRPGSQATATAPRAGNTASASGTSARDAGTPSDPREPPTTTDAAAPLERSDASAPASGPSAVGSSADASVIGSAPRRTPQIDEPNDEAVYVFDQAELRTYDVIIDPADLATIDANPAGEEWVPAMLQFENKEYGPFMVRYKGAAGAFRPPCTTSIGEGPKTGKCSLKLGFDEVNQDLRFFGLKTLNFHTMNNDGSMLRERLGYSLFRDSAVAAPRAAHARLLVNGQFQGLFAVVEQIDGRFTRARFSDGGEGNLYKEVWPTFDAEDPYIWQLQTNEDENPSAANMVRLHEAISTGTSQTEEFFDRDYMLRYLAVDRVTTNDDGVFHFFCSPEATTPPNNHNYYWYEAEGSARFWLIPWDLDQTFHSSSWAHIEVEWTEQTDCTCRMVGQGHQFPASCDPLVSRFIDWLPDFETEVDAFIAGPYAASRVREKLAAWASQIEPVVIEAAEAEVGPSHEGWMRALEELEGEIDMTRSNRGAPY